MRAASWAASTTCSGVGKSGSPTSRWMTSGSSQARSMISRMRETGMELAIDDGRAGFWPILVSCGRNDLPPLPVGALQDTPKWPTRCLFRMSLRVTPLIRLRSSLVDRSLGNYFLRAYGELVGPVVPALVRPCAPGVPLDLPPPHL